MHTSSNNQDDLFTSIKKFRALITDILLYLCLEFYLSHGNHLSVNIFDYDIFKGLWTKSLLTMIIDDVARMK